MFLGLKGVAKFTHCDSFAEFNCVKLTLHVLQLADKGM